MPEDRLNKILDNPRRLAVVKQREAEIRDEAQRATTGGAASGGGTDASAGAKGAAASAVGGKPGKEAPAIIDSATQTYTLQSFATQLESEIERCKRYRQYVTVGAVCVDTFAREKLSALASDAVLNSIVSTLKSCLRREDLCAHYNDQTFIVMFGGLAAPDAALIAERIRYKIGTQAIAYNWRNVKVTASIGLASYPMHAAQADELIAGAVAVAVAALNAGGDRIVII